MNSSLQNKDNSRNDTNFLRAIAILLIINSHMKGYYPIQLLSTGGMIGNSIFFMLSSFGLFLSWKSNRNEQPILSWYGRRIVRIYPSVWMTILLIMVPYALYRDAIKGVSILGEMSVFYYPPFWFLQALMSYYVVAYFILKKYSTRLISIVALAVMILYLFYYCIYLDLTTFSIETPPIRIIYYFLIFLWGIYLASRNDDIRYAGPTDFILVFVFLGCIYGNKYLMTNGDYGKTQIIQHLALIPLLYYLLKIAKSDFISKSLMNSWHVGKLLCIISTMTLELFMINNLLGNIALGAHLTFPSNVIVFISVNIILSTIIYYSGRRVRRALESNM